MSDSERHELSARLAKAGWIVDGSELSPGGIKVGLRVAPDTSGDPARYIYGADVNDALRKELERLEAESNASEP
jgi:hypothetical protein